MTPREKLYRLIPGVICASLVSYGMCVSLLMSYLLPAPPGYTLLYVFIVTLVTALLSYNIKTGAAFLAVISVGVVYIWRNAEEYIERLIVVNDALYYARTFLTGADLPAGYDLRIVFFVVIIIVCVPVGLFLSRMRGGVAFLLIAASVFVAQWLLGHTSVLPYMCLSVCGLVPVFAYEAARHNKKRDAALRPPAASLALFMLIPAIVIAWLSYTILPANTSGLKSPIVIYTLNSINNALSPYTGLGGINADYSIGSMGFNSNEALLGGPAFLRDSEVLRITGDKPLLLRGSVFNVYTGSSWKKELDEEPREFYNAAPETEVDRMFEELRREMASPERGRFYSALSNSPLYEPLKFTVTALGPVGRTIFSTGAIFGVYPHDEKAMYIDKMGGISSDIPFKINDSYTEYVYDLKFNSPEFTELMLYLGNQQPLSMAQSDNVYLALPESLPDTVTELAESLTADAESDYAGMLAIEKYLMENFTYTLRPSYPDRDVDFVQHFFDTGEGYCVYFATAMAVLARAAGFPARYVEGFSLGNVEANADGDYIVRARNAHAWTEIWLDSAGWVPFDATPADLTTGTGGLPETVPELEPEPEDMPENEPEDTPESAPEPDEEKTPEKAPFPVFRVLAAILIILAVLAVPAAVFLNKYLRRRRYDPALSARRMPKARARAEYYWRDALKTLAKMGFSPAGQTPREFAAGVSAAAPVPGFDGVFETMELLIYGGMEPEPEQLDRMILFAGELDAQRRAAAGPGLLIKKLFSSNGR